MSLFTQWVPHTWCRGAARRGARRVRRSGHRRVHGAGPELQAVDRAPPGDRPVRDGARRTGSSAATSSTASSRPTSSSTCGPPPATPTSRRRSTGCTSARRPRTAAGECAGIPGWQAAQRRPRRPAAHREGVVDEESCTDRRHAVSPIVLAPFGHSRMLPRSAYVSDAVLAWEREHFFDGGVGLRRPGERPRESAATEALKVGRHGVLLHPRRRRRACTRSPTSAATAATSCCRAARAPTRCRSSARTTRGATNSTARSGSRPASATFPTSRPSTWASSACRHESGAAGFRQRVRRRRPLADVHRRLRRRVRALRAATASSLSRRHEYLLAANWKLPHRELPRVLPLPADPSRAVRGQPAEQRRQLSHASGCVGRRDDGPRAARRNDVAGRRGGRRSRPGHSTRCSGARSSTSGLFPNLLHQPAPRLRDDPPHRAVDAVDEPVECAWLFAPERWRQPGFDPSYAVDFWDLTNRQDWSAVESVQRGMASPHYRPGLLSSQEDAVYQFVTMVARGYIGEPVTSAPLQ